MQFPLDWSKDNKLQLFKFFTRKLGKISLDWALWCASTRIESTAYPCKARVSQLVISSNEPVCCINSIPFPPSLYQACKQTQKGTNNAFTKKFYWQLGNPFVLSASSCLSAGGMKHALCSLLLLAEGAACNSKIREGGKEEERERNIISVVTWSTLIRRAKQILAREKKKRAHVHTMLSST